jgi:hypothetical protein
MSKEVKNRIHKNFMITVSLSNSAEKGKYIANARNFFGQTIPPEDSIKLPTFTTYGNDPDELIEQLKSDLDQHLENA